MRSLAAALPLLALSASASASVSQVHVAVAGEASDGMAISFVTATADDCPESRVRYGLDEGDLAQGATGRQIQYLRSGGWNHHVVLDGLVPDAVYYYSVCGEARVRHFRTVPDASTRELSFAVWGDLGGAGNGLGDHTMAFLKERVESHNVSLLWHAGDVGYADDAFLHRGCVFNFCYEQAYDSFMQDMERVGADSVPWMVLPGNHEADCHSPACLLSSEYRAALSNFSAYSARFRMPSAESGGAANQWYSFDAGPVHFVSLDLETGYPGAAEEKRYVLPCGGFGDMLSWLEADLRRANAQRGARPWILAAGHHPMYDGRSVNTGLAEALEGLFEAYGVDVLFAGHVHSYARSWPTRGGRPTQRDYVNPAATTHLVVGGAGNDEMAGKRRALRRRLKDLDASKPVVKKTNAHLYTAVAGNEWNAFKDEGSFGVGLVRANATHLRFQYVRTAEGRVFDEITIVKDAAAAA